MHSWSGDIEPRCKDSRRYSATDDTEVEAEILQTEEIDSSISTAKAKIVQRLIPTLAATPPQRTEVHTTPSSVPIHEHVTQLPKLDLLQFTGNPLN